MATPIQAESIEVGAPKAGGGWAQTLELFRDDLNRVARRRLGADLASKIDASDVVQDTMHRAVRGLRRFRGRTTEKLGGWLRSILASSLSHARRHHRDAARRQVEREVSIEVVGDPASKTTSASWLAIRSEQEAAMVVALLVLSERERRVISARFRDGLAFGEIGDHLGISAEAARKVCARATRRLQDAMGAGHDVA